MVPRDWLLCRPKARAGGGENGGNGGNVSPLPAVLGGPGEAGGLLDEAEDWFLLVPDASTQNMYALVHLALAENDGAVDTWMLNHNGVWGQLAAWSRQGWFPDNTEEIL